MEMKAKTGIEIVELRCGYGGREVIHGVSLTVPRGSILGLAGPNGSGKSTLLRAMTGILKPYSGRVTIDGAEVSRMTRREVARKVAVVPQDISVGFEFTVRDVVSMGRTPHLRMFQPETAGDRRAVEEALDKCGVRELADRLPAELSSGERQRVALARALAQNPEYLLLDEPTAHLDIGHQGEVLELVADLRRSRGLTVVAVLHDLNLAAMYVDSLCLIKDGRVKAMGGPDEVVTPQVLRDVYGIEAAVVRNPFTGGPVVVADPGARGGVPLVQEGSGGGLA